MIEGRMMVVFSYSQYSHHDNKRNVVDHEPRNIQSFTCLRDHTQRFHLFFVFTAAAKTNQKVPFISM